MAPIEGEPIGKGARIDECSSREKRWGREGESAAIDGEPSSNGARIDEEY